VELDRNGLEVLDRTECLHLLARATFGRVATTASALPTILPVNYCLDGDTIIIRTGEGAKLDAAARNAVVAFEADELDSIYHAGWSVVVTGIAREVTDPEQLTQLQHAPVRRWAPRGDGCVMAISTAVISGRRILPGSGGEQVIKARTSP